MPLSRVTLIQRIRDILEDHPFETTGDAASGTSTITVADGTMWGPMNIGEFQEDGDTFLSRSVSGTTVTAVRSYEGTTGAFHAVGSRLWKDPDFRFSQIDNAVKTILRSLWPHAWRKLDVSITPNTTDQWFNGNADSIDVFQAVQRYGATNERIGFYTTKYWGRRTGRLVIMERNLPTALVTSGVGLRFPEGFYHSSNVVQVSTRARIRDSVTSGNYDDLVDGTMAEAVVFGAVAHLLVGKEVPRITQQDVRQGDRSVGPGARVAASGYYRALYQQTLSKLRRELEQEMPYTAKE